MSENTREVRFTRQELYEQVWERPASHIARDYGLTPNAIIVACREHDIPRPGSGYWTQRDFGKTVPRVPLPPKPDGDVILLRVPEPEPAPQGQRNLPTPGTIAVKIPSTATPNPVAAVEPAVVPPCAPPVKKPETITVSDVLTRPHPLVARAGRNLRGARTDAKGLLVPKEWPCLEVRVTPGSLNRALRIMDAVLKALVKRKMAVELVSDQGVHTQVTAKGEKLTIGIVEKTSRREKPLSPAEQRKKDRDPNYYHFREYIYLPTDELTLWVEGDFGWSRKKRTWGDGKRVKVEDRLDEFIAGVLETADGVRQAREERERKERERHEKRIRGLEIARLKEAEKKRVDELDQEVAGWLRAKRIREYVEAVKHVAQGDDAQIQCNEKLLKWMDWALQQADRADPLCDSPPSVLDEPDYRDYW